MAFNYWQNLEETGIYHLYNRSVNKENLFKNDSGYNRFLNGVQKYLSPYLDIYAYCFMPNHFHFLVEVKTKNHSMETDLRKEKSKAALLFLNGNIDMNKFIEDQFRRLFSSYALWYNIRYNRRGTLFQKRLKRVQIINEVKQLLLICYIHHNPIHHKFARSYSEWKYTSFHNYFSKGEADGIREKIFQWIGDGDTEAGKELLYQYHVNFKQPSSDEDWLLD